MSTHSYRLRPRAEPRRPSLGASFDLHPPFVDDGAPSIESPNHPQSSARSDYANSSQSRVTASIGVSKSLRQSEAGSRSNETARVATPRSKLCEDSQIETVSESGAGRRVAHACEPCRHRKTKCSGERPLCWHCQNLNVKCYYGDGKRDRVKKQFGNMTEKVADYEKFLKGLLDRVDEGDSNAIKALLGKDAMRELLDGARYGESPPNAEEDVVPKSRCGSTSPTRKASTGPRDRTVDAVVRETAQVAEFVGENLEITWLAHYVQETQTVNGAPLGDRVSQTAIALPEMQVGFYIQDPSYHLDDLPIDGFDAFDPYEMPPLETAQALFTSYITRCHPTFPIVGKIVLSTQFDKFISGHIQNPPPQWLAIINLIFAVSAKYAHLTQAQWNGNDHDHLVYFSRARKLAMNEGSILQHTDLQQVQVMGLMSFYLLCTGQINRSWMIGGMALRGAIALGMNLRNESATLGDDLKEIRYRVWWALYSLEHQLCSITGRNNYICNTMCTTPLPIHLDEEQFETPVYEAMLHKGKRQNDSSPRNSAPTPLPSFPSAVDGSVLLPKVKIKVKAFRSPSSQPQLFHLDRAKTVTPGASLYFLHLVQLTHISCNIAYNLYSPSSVTGAHCDVQDRILELENSVENWYGNLPSVLDFKRKQRVQEFHDYQISLGCFYYGTKITISRPCLCHLDQLVQFSSTSSHHFYQTQAIVCVDSAQELLNLIPDVPNAVGLNSIAPWWNIIHWLVQATSVLILEMSVRTQHMSEEFQSIFESSKKAVRWLHALGTNDVSARRAWVPCNSQLRSYAAKISCDVTDLPTKAPGRRNSLPSHGPADRTMEQLMSDYTQAESPASYAHNIL